MVLIVQPPLQESLTAVMEVIELGVSGTVSSVSLSIDIHCTLDLCNYYSIMHMYMQF